MAISIPATITGGAQTGFTSPTYTASTDKAPDVNMNQSAVTALGGTQVGVTSHTVSSPFTVTVVKPKAFGVLGKPNPTTGLISNVPRNTWKLLVRKGVTPAAGQPFQVAIGRLELEIPAGSDTYDAANVRAMISCLIGVLSSLSSGIGDTAVTGVL